MLLWDYRGCGGSDTPKRLDTLTMENYCSDLLTVLDHLDIQKAVFLGHSMGVLTILEFYRRFPERVAGLIPVCGSFENPFSTLWGTRNLLPFVNILLKIMEYCPGLVDTFWHLWMATPAGRESILWLGTNRFMVRSDDLEGFIANFSKMSALSFSKAAQNLANQNARDILSQISVPALVVAGENDFWTPLFISEEMADFIPDASLCIVPRGSHTAILDIPELIGLRIEKFLSEKTDSD
jgi:pimeloyl-ACP methyl ester carboxylesterase